MVEGDQDFVEPARRPDQRTGVVGWNDRDLYTFTLHPDKVKTNVV